MTKDEMKHTTANIKEEKQQQEESKKDPVDDSSSSSSIITELRQVTLEMIESRAEGKTCWPSEVPRRLAKQGKGKQKNNWRDWMPLTHSLMRDLVKEGILEITQKGAVVENLSEMRGPYRIRKTLDEWVVSSSQWCLYHIMRMTTLILSWIFEVWLCLKS